MLVAPAAGRHKDVAAIDFEFAEANRTCTALSTALRGDLMLYRQIATACMAIRTAAAASDAYVTARAVEKLRSRTTEYATGCEKLKRDKVEMLLLAIEILLKPGVEPDVSKRNIDATRMMAVLGETTKVASHPELTDYFERFQKIASALGAPAAGAVAAGSSLERLVVPTAFQKPAPSSETLLFYMRIAPALALKLTAERAEPLPAAEPPLIRSPDRSAPSALSKAH
jgi:hypothetical protein